MSWNEDTETVPIREDEAGALRVGETRVLVDLVVNAFDDGAMPEEIAQRYSTLHLPDVYAVIAYVLKHRPAIDEYLARRAKEAGEVRARIEALQPDMSGIRARLLARRAEMERDHASTNSR